jgi:hypothetical protein
MTTSPNERLKLRLVPLLWNETTIPKRRKEKIH